MDFDDKIQKVMQALLGKNIALFISTGEDYWKFTSVKDICQYLYFTFQEVSSTVWIMSLLQMLEK